MFVITFGIGRQTCKNNNIPIAFYTSIVVVVQINYIRQQPKCEDEPWDRPTTINDNNNVMQQIIFICIFAHTCIYYYIWIKIIKSLL